MARDQWQEAIRKAYLETKKIQDDYVKVRYEWSNMKPFIIAYLEKIGWSFRANAGWLGIIDMLFKECLKMRLLWLGSLFENEENKVE